MGDSDAVVGHRGALASALVDARKHELAVEHASAAMDDQVIACQVFRKIFAGHNVHGQSLPHTLSQHAGNLFTTDVFGQWGMGARLGNEDARLLSQAINGHGAPHKETDIALVGSHQYRERGEKALGRLFLLHDVKYLGVGDNQVWRFFKAASVRSISSVVQQMATHPLSIRSRKV